MENSSENKNSNSSFYCGDYDSQELNDNNNNYQISPYQNSYGNNNNENGSGNENNYGKQQLQYNGINVTKEDLQISSMAQKTQQQCAFVEDTPENYFQEHGSIGPSFLPYIHPIENNQNQQLHSEQELIKEGEEYGTGEFQNEENNQNNQNVEASSLVLHDCSPSHFFTLENINHWNWKRIAEGNDLSLEFGSITYLENNSSNQLVQKNAYRIFSNIAKAETKHWEAFRDAFNYIYDQKIPSTILLVGPHLNSTTLSVLWKQIRFMRKNEKITRQYITDIEIQINPNAKKILDFLFQWYKPIEEVRICNYFPVSQ